VSFLPRTLFWRAFSAQLLLMIASFALVIAFITRDHARTTADNIVGIWAPALQAALTGTDRSIQKVEIGVQRQVTLFLQDPPGDAYEPWGSPRFSSLRTGLQQQGIAVERIVVSGVTGDSRIWMQVRQDAGQRWIGVASTLEGEDFPVRVAVLTGVGLMLAASLAAVLSAMVARPARELARAVEAFGHGLVLPAMPAMPTRAPAEIAALAQTVARTFEQRRELDEQRSLMLAGLSHDVRSPLARIHLAAELLAEPDTETRDLKRRILQNAQVLDRLVGSFADYIRAEQGALDEMVDVGAVASSVAASFGLNADAVAIDSSLEVRSHGDLVRRALDNLVDNALRYGAEPVTVSVASGPGCVRVMVANAGPAIDAEEIDRLRRPFERGQRHRSSPGTGLGLAIVERIARRHGGSLALHPVASGGTRVVLVLGKSPTHAA
jgi:two-component system, OmpR family, osmolarity sensor histidine kinase EnvZ